MFLKRFIKISSFQRNIYITKCVVRDMYIVSKPLSRQQRSFSIANICQTNAEMKDLKFEGLVRPVMEKKDPTANQSKTAADPEKKSRSENLLEKLIAGLSTDIYQKNRVYKNDFLKVLNKIKEQNFSSKKQGLLLLRCCTELMPDETPVSRMMLAEKVWNALEPHTTFTVEHYNQLLQVYIANSRTINAASFIKLMAPVTPDITTYELILTCLGEAGDVNQATEVIANMKANNIPATENVFNSLIIAQGKSGNLQNIPEVVSAMKSLRIEHTVNTRTAVARVLAWNKKNDQLIDELEKARRSGIAFKEEHVMAIVKTLAVVSNYEPVPNVLKYLPQETLNKPSISPYMQSVATFLVYQNCPMVALEIYKCLPLPAFGPKDDQGLHGRSLVRDCVKAGLPSGVIRLVTQDLMATGRNPIALQNAAEAALQMGKTLLALELFTQMKQLGMGLRTHYFWPILVHSSRTRGENALMSTLRTMITMGVNPDYETIMNYTLPYVSFTSPQHLMKKLLDTGLTVTNVLTPMMETLVNTGQLRAASELSQLFQGKIESDKLLKPLVKGYILSMDATSLVQILREMQTKSAQKNMDWVGRFLCAFLQHDKFKANPTEFITVLKALNKGELKISSTLCDYIAGRIPNSLSKEKSEQIKSLLSEMLDDNIIDDGEIFVTKVQHPKDMNEESLKAHLIELDAKGMNTRGVLRKLLQEYCRLRNWEAAKEIAERCQREGVHMSPGMKASIFNIYVNLKNIEQAEAILADINEKSPDFVLDEFKVIDFATILVTKKKFDRAIQLIMERAKKKRIVGGNSLSMNCWRLLSAVAIKLSAAETRKMFETLVSLRYCTASNAMLGPLVGVHLKHDDLDEAFQEFVELSEKYHKTPLKHELLTKILKDMSEGQTEEHFIENEMRNGRLNKMAQTILSIDKEVHGASTVQLTLIAALAEAGYKKTLRKMVLDPNVKFHPDALLRQCERFADEKKVAPLLLIAECAKDVRHVDVTDIYEMIVDVYSRTGDYKGALVLWEKMQEANVAPTEKIVNHICELCRNHQTPLPDGIATFIKDKERVPNK